MIQIMDDVMIWEDEDVTEFQRVLQMPTDEVAGRARLLGHEIDVMKKEIIRIKYEAESIQAKTKDNNDRINRYNRLPYLVSTVVEIIDNEFEDEDQDGATHHADVPRTNKCVLIKTTTKFTIFLAGVGLVNVMQLRPGDLVGVNPDSYGIIEKLPAESDYRIKVMVVDERPDQQYSDIGGLDKQIAEIIESVVLPLTHKEKFDRIGIQAPKGVLIYGEPGTGKTLLARACAAETKSTFLKLAGTQLVDRYIGEGAKILRDAFALAKSKAPTIIFIDELDAIGTKRFDSNKEGDREVQRTMLELLNQMDGFQSATNVKVIAATNRIDVLDAALLRSGRFDRKIEFPYPNKEARSSILQIHTRKMEVSSDINYQDLAGFTDGFNGAQCRAVCCEAGMIALRRNAGVITHEDFMEAIIEVQARKKSHFNYYV